MSWNADSEPPDTTSPQSYPQLLWKKIQQGLAEHFLQIYARLQCA